jgi:protocatechuate 3,4-dioxygenase beta subunit
VVALAVGGSAAAAYTNNLPEPIQRFAHRALGPVAPPAPERHHPHTARDFATVAPTTSATPTPTVTPSATPTPSMKPSPTHKPAHPDSPSSTPSASATPSVAPTPTSTPTGTASPSATPTTTPTTTPTVVPSPPVAAALTISGTTHKVEPGQPVTFSGTVTADDGTAMRGTRVKLQILSDGRWVNVVSNRADAAGAVTLVLPQITATTGVRLRTAGVPSVHSARWRVTLHPSLSVTSAPGFGAGTVVITATALGAQPGDRIQLMSKGGQVATGTLDGGTVSFTVTPTKKETRYVVLLPGTSAHGSDHASITVIVKRPVGTGPSPGSLSGGH